MERLYFTTLLALVLHQIDAAFWQEWTMFSVPGGVQGFVLFNLVAVGVLLFGYRSVVLGRASARGWALTCGVVGVGTFVLHVGFAAVGHREFNLPASMAVLVACLIAGAALIWTAQRSRRHR